MTYDNMSREELIKKLKKQELEIKKLEEISSLDELTKTFSRRAGIERFNKLYENSIINNEDISICFIDVDNLKFINDTGGHKSGDEALVNITSIIRTNIRKDDFIFRYGGDEFIIIFPRTNKEVANNILKRICRIIKEGNSYREYELSLSYGLCNYKEYEERDMSFNDFLIHADSQMYINKNNNLSLVSCKRKNR